jgi:hypothetical protein
MKHRLPKAKSVTTRSGDNSGMEQTELLMGEGKPGSPRDSSQPHHSPSPTIPENEASAAGEPKSPSFTDGASHELADGASPADGKENGEVAPGEAKSRRTTPPPLPTQNSRPFYIPEMKPIPAGPEPAPTGERSTMSDTVPMPTLTEEKPTVIESFAEGDAAKKPLDTVAEKVLLKSPVVTEINPAVSESLLTGGKHTLESIFSSALSFFYRRPRQALRDADVVSESPAVSETMSYSTRPPI